MTRLPLTHGSDLQPVFTQTPGGRAGLAMFQDRGPHTGGSTSKRAWSRHEVSGDAAVSGNHELFRARADDVKE